MRYRRATRVFLTPSVVSVLTFQLDGAGKPTDINTLACRGQCTSGSTSSAPHRSCDQPQTPDELIPGVGEIKLALKKLRVTFGTWNQPSASHCWRSLWCTFVFRCSDLMTRSLVSGSVLACELTGLSRIKMSAQRWLRLSGVATSCITTITQVSDGTNIHTSGFGPQMLYNFFFFF